MAVSAKLVTAQIDEHDRRIASLQTESLASFLQFRDEPREIVPPLVRPEGFFARPVVIPRKQVDRKGRKAEADRQAEVLIEEGSE